MRRTIIALALVLFTSTIRAECSGPNLAVNAADQTLAATFDAKDVPPVKMGDKVSVAVGTTVLDTEVIDVRDALGDKIVDLKKPTAAEVQGGTFVFDTELTTDQAQFNYKDSNGEDKSVALCLIGHFNTRFDSMAIGPTMAQDEEADSDASGGTDDDADGEETRPSAIRLQYGTSFRRFSEVLDGNPTKIPSMRLIQQEFAVSIDTTDQEGEGFIDDNKIMAGVFSPRITLGNAINRVRLGVVGQHARAFHSDDNNSDIKLSIDGWLPLFQAANIASTKRRLALPLQFRISAGKRWQDVDELSSNGDVAEWSLLYHLYLFDDYRLDLEHKTVFNDVDNRPVSTPRTQHSWKATVLFMGDEDSRFNVVASFEDGHSGPVFTELRQFFIGVGFKNGLGSILGQ